MRTLTRIGYLAFWAASLLLAAGAANAQTAASSSDTPSVKIGGTIFADYTYQSNPNIVDATGNKTDLTSFNIGRAYLNVTGNLNHLLAFRITPDIARETGGGSSLAGSYTFRLKYAYGQLNLDDWAPKGTWVRFGQQQTPYVDFFESIYRYRFQGPVFVDKEGFMTSSDLGVSGHYNLPGNYGDIHAGYYNGEGYNHAETNNQKALQARVTLRPLPESAALKGLRLTLFADRDAYVSGAERNRLVPAVTYESKWVNGGIEYVKAKDQTSTAKPEANAKGWSAFLNPKIGHGWEVLLRHDDLKPNESAGGRKRRDVAGVAYWIPNLEKVSAALMLDAEAVNYRNIAKPDETRVAIHTLINF
jgi:Phosphate-selective porin O and P